MLSLPEEDVMETPLDGSARIPAVRSACDPSSAKFDGAWPVDRHVRSSWIAQRLASSSAHRPIFSLETTD